MTHLKKKGLTGEMLPGRIITKAVGKDSPCISGKMSVGFARYCEEAGAMKPHQHAEETIYVVASDRAYVRKGSEENEMGERVPLEAGDILHFSELEWHVFEYEPGGMLEILFIYGQVDNIRPEEILHAKI